MFLRLINSFMVIIADTSCLITLDRSDELSILFKVFGEVTITPDIRNEFKSSLPDWIKEIDVQNKAYQKLLEKTLDKGESSAIALAQEIGNTLLILDEVKGRKVAHQLRLNFTGTLGVLLEAKKSGHIKSVRDIITKLKNHEFRISDDVEMVVLNMANEL